MIVRCFDGSDATSADRDVRGVGRAEDAIAPRGTSRSRRWRRSARDLPI